MGRVGFDGYNCRAKGSTTLSSNEEKPVGLAVDSNAKVVFWSNDQNAQPGDSWLTKVCAARVVVVCACFMMHVDPQANFDGTGKTEFIQGMYDPQGSSLPCHAVCEVVTVPLPRSLWIDVRCL